MSDFEVGLVVLAILITIGLLIWPMWGPEEPPKAPAQIGPTSPVAEEAQSAPIEPSAPAPQIGPTSPAAEEAQSAPIVAAPEKVIDFDEFMNARAEYLGAKWLHSKIAGVTFPNRNGTSRQERIPLLKPRQELVLRRERNNPHSKTAVAIDDAEGHQLGYVPDGLSQDVSLSLDWCAEAEVYVNHIGQSDDGHWGAAIGVLWVRQIASEAFEKAVSEAPLHQDWFWGSLTGITKCDDGMCDRQSAIMGLKSCDVLNVDPDWFFGDGDRILLSTSDSSPIANLSKAQTGRVLDDLKAGWKYVGIVFGLTQRDDGVYKPKIAIVRLKEGVPSPFESADTHS